MKNIIDKILLEGTENISNKMSLDLIDPRFTFLYRDVTRFIHPEDKFKAIEVFKKFINNKEKANFSINPQMLILCQNSRTNGIPTVIKLCNVYYAVAGFKDLQPNLYTNPNDKIMVKLLDTDKLNFGNKTKTNFDF